MTVNYDHYCLYTTVSCDWCHRSIGLQDTKENDRAVAHYHKVECLETKKSLFRGTTIVKRNRHICTVCLDDHKPFHYVDNGVVKFDHFKIKKTRKKQNGK